MEWIGITNSIINRKGKNTELENTFGENELTNIIVSVLLFIMEKTLEENNECEMHHIEAFLDELTRLYYSKAFSKSQLKDIAGYIIKDILQNNGVRYTYSLVNYTKKSSDEITIRLIADKIVDENNERKIVYMLTNQGYEFLFRMREVDEEIQLTIEQLKLKEYIKRKKFTSAVRQSVELITFVRQKKKDLENFILSIRQNIHNVDIEKYEALIKSTYAMLTEEYETMADIQKMIDMAEEKIKEEFNAGVDFEQKLAKAKSEIREIHHNIGIVITEQRDLIINRHSLTNLYMDTIKKSFEFSFEKRYDFEETILMELERYNNVLDNCLSLLKPLLLPGINRLMGIGDIYEAQAIFKDVENQDSHLVASAYYLFNTNDPFRSVGIVQTELLGSVIQRKLGAGINNESIKLLIRLVIESNVDTNTLHSGLTLEFVYSLKTTDSKEIAIKQCLEIKKELDKEAPPKKSWSSDLYRYEEKVNELVEMVLRLNVALCEYDEGIMYFYRNYIEKDKEITLYILQDILLEYELKDVWLREYDRALVKGVKPRDALQLTHKYIQKYDKLPEYMIRYESDVL